MQPYRLYQRIVRPPSLVVSGVLSAFGVGGATFVGAATGGTGDLLATGAASASFVGAATAAGDLSTAGVGTFSAFSTGSVLSVAGVGTASFVGRSTAAGVFSAQGTGSALIEMQDLEAVLAKRVLLTGVHEPEVELDGVHEGTIRLTVVLGD